MLLHDTTAAILESMNSKYVGIWKDQIKAYFKVLSMSSPGQTAENQENPIKVTETWLRTKMSTSSVTERMPGLPTSLHKK
jgi:hypothetical protein